MGNLVYYYIHLFFSHFYEKLLKAEICQVFNIVHHLLYILDKYFSKGEQILPKMSDPFCTNLNICYSKLGATFVKEQIKKLKLI